jgi:hypothetical protein
VPHIPRRRCGGRIGRRTLGTVRRSRPQIKQPLNLSDQIVVLGECCGERWRVAQLGRPAVACSPTCAVRIGTRPGSSGSGRRGLSPATACHEPGRPLAARSPHLSPSGHTSIDMDVDACCCCHPSVRRLVSQPSAVQTGQVDPRLPAHHLRAYDSLA